MTGQAAPTEAPSGFSGEPLEIEAGAIRRIRVHDYAIRFGFGFLISVVAGAVTLVAGQSVGGLFLAFPAILPATLTLLEKKDGTAQAASDVRGASIGALGLIAFAAAVAALVRLSGFGALIAALGLWCVVTGLLYVVLRTAVAASRERHYLPEIPIEELTPLVRAMREHGLSVATAESATGGILGALLSSVPGCADFYRGSVSSYTPAGKAELLGVPRSLIDARGTVDPAVAAAMADGASRALHSDIGIAITGLIGSDAEGKPAGLTYVAVRAPGSEIEVREFTKDHGPGRNDERAVRMALALALDVVVGGDRTSRYLVGAANV